MQDAPYTIKLELTEGCNLRCSMCGIQGIREKAGGPYLYMETKTAEVIAKRIAESGWSSRIEFTLRGEPLMNPNSAEIVGIMRKHLPNTSIMLTTNGLPLLRKPGCHENLDALFAAGLNVLAMDCYEASKKAEEKVRQYTKVEIYDYPGKVSPYGKIKTSQQRIIMMEDLESAIEEGRSLGVKVGNNHCGAGMPAITEPLNKRCAKPFRELSIRHDGRVMLCCNDWRGVYKIGSVLEQGLVDLWNSEALVAARRHLYHYSRKFAPCNVCNNVSYRVGLLPDRLGKQTMPEPSTEDRIAVRKASAGKTMTPIVFRQWERK